MTFLKSLLNISGTLEPEFTKQYALLPTVLQIHDDCRLVWEELTVLEISPLSQWAGRKGPWGLTTGVPASLGAASSELLIVATHMRQSFFITCLYGLVSPLQYVKLKSDKGNAVLEIFISSRAA